MGWHRLVCRRHQPVLRHRRRADAPVPSVAARAGQRPGCRHHGVRGARRALLRVRRSQSQRRVGGHRDGEQAQLGSAPHPRHQPHGRRNDGAGTRCRRGVRPRPLGRQVGGAHQRGGHRLPGDDRPDRPARRVDRTGAARTRPAHHLRGGVRRPPGAARVGRRAATHPRALPRWHRAHRARRRRTPRPGARCEPRVAGGNSPVRRAVAHSPGHRLRGGCAQRRASCAEADTRAGRRSAGLRKRAAVGHLARWHEGAGRHRLPQGHARRRHCRPVRVRLRQLRIVDATVVQRGATLVAGSRRGVGAGAPSWRWRAGPRVVLAGQARPQAQHVHRHHCQCRAPRRHRLGAPRQGGAARR